MSPPIRSDAPSPGAASSRFGSAILPEWPLDPAGVYLNHGTVGVTPRVVLATQTEIRDRVERHPSRELLREVVPLVGGAGHGRLRAAAEEVARFFGARGDDLVFVENDTTAINAVLRSLPLSPGDDVLTMDTTYGGVRQAVRYICRRTGAGIVVAEHPCPLAGPEAVLEAVERALTPRTRLALLDHIVSETGVVMPLAELIALCRARVPGIRVLVDGAHVPGQLALEIPALAADWYAANLHKWAFAPRNCGILWAAPEAQLDLHPAVISWHLDEGFTAEFDWNGTRDVSAFLAAPAGLAFLERLGFADARRYCHDLLWSGVALLADRLAAFGAGEPIVAVAPPTMSGSMTSVRLPSIAGADPADARRLRDALLFEHDIEVAVSAWHERLWMRLSVQVYNELRDFERVADALAALFGRRAPARPGEP